MRLDGLEASLDDLETDKLLRRDLERANGDAGVGRVPTGTVGLGQMRVDHLRVPLRTQSSRLEQRQATQHAPPVHVLA